MVWVTYGSVLATMGSLTQGHVTLHLVSSQSHRVHSRLLGNIPVILQTTARGVSGLLTVSTKRWVHLLFLSCHYRLPNCEYVSLLLIIAKQVIHLLGFWRHRSLPEFAPC